MRAQSAGSASGLPVPRFVSLKADKVNMHIGPAKTYETKWLYQRAGLPVEITAEFENWRRIRDADGTEGWVYHSLLSGKRTGMVTAKTPDDLVAVYEKPDAESAVTAKLERGVVGTVKRCAGRAGATSTAAASRAGSSRCGCGASIRTRRWIERGASPVALAAVSSDRSSLPSSRSLRTLPSPAGSSSTG